MRVKLPAYGVATWPPPDRCLLPKTVFEDIEKDAKCEGLGGATFTFSQRPFLALLRHTLGREPCLKLAYKQTSLCVYRGPGKGDDGGDMPVTALTACTLSSARKSSRISRVSAAHSAADEAYRLSSV